MSYEPMHRQVETNKRALPGAGDDWQASLLPPRRQVAGRSRPAAVQNWPALEVSAGALAGALSSFQRRSRPTGAARRYCPDRCAAGGYPTAGRQRRERGSLEAGARRISVIARRHEPGRHGGDEGRHWRPGQHHQAGHGRLCRLARGGRPAGPAGTAGAFRAPAHGRVAADNDRRAGDVAHGRAGGAGR